MSPVEGFIIHEAIFSCSRFNPANYKLQRSNDSLRRYYIMMYKLGAGSHRLELNEFKTNKSWKLILIITNFILYYRQLKNQFTKVVYTTAVTRLILNKEFHE